MGGHHQHGGLRRVRQLVPGADPLETKPKEVDSCYTRPHVLKQLIWFSEAKTNERRVSATITHSYHSIQKVQLLGIQQGLGFAAYGMEWHGIRVHVLEWNGIRVHVLEWNGIRVHVLEWHGIRVHVLEWNGIRVHVLELLEWNGMALGYMYWNGMALGYMYWNGMVWH